jgi:uncharacterized protein YuzE
MKITGSLKVKNDTIQVSEQFSKREFVVTVVDGAFSNDILIQLTKDKCVLIDAFNIGDMLEVEINLKGRGVELRGAMRYFNSIEAWKITKL